VLEIQNMPVYFFSFFSRDSTFFLERIGMCLVLEIHKIYPIFFIFSPGQYLIQSLGCASCFFPRVRLMPIFRA
jgi:hypothetical protein